MAPLFSIITVTLDAAETVATTARSIREQSCSLYEWIVQDGGSADATLEVVKGAGISQLKLVSEPDGGIYDAMNRALTRAEGDYVIFLNAGDAFASPDTLQLIADAVMDNDYPGVAYGQTRIVDAEGNALHPRHLEAPEVLTVDSFKDGMVVCHQAFVVLRKIAPEYDTRYRFSADYDWCLKCIERSRRNLYIDAVLIDYLNVGMTTRNRRRSLWERFRIMCYRYGTLPTMWRHLGFALRFISHKRKGLQ